MGAVPITLPTDAVSLHRGIPDVSAEPGEQIGETVTVSEPGTVTFPPHCGEPINVYVVAWHDGQVMWCGTPGWEGLVFDGQVVTVQVPIAGTLSMA